MKQNAPRSYPLTVRYREAREALDACRYDPVLCEAAKHLMKHAEIEVLENALQIAGFSIGDLVVRRRHGRQSDAAVLFAVYVSTDSDADFIPGATIRSSESLLRWEAYFDELEKVSA